MFEEFYMKCSSCGIEVIKTKKGIAPKQKNMRAKLFGVPFYCEECGAIKCPIKAVCNAVFIWPFPPEKKFENTGMIHIPETYQEYYPADKGVVISSGTGRVDTVKGKRIPNRTKVGDVVTFDKTTLWTLSWEGNDGKVYEFRRMGDQDVYGYVEDFDYADITT